MVNAVTVMICVMTMLTVPKIAGSLNAADKAETGQRAISGAETETGGSDGSDSSGKTGGSDKSGGVGGVGDFGGIGGSGEVGAGNSVIIFGEPAAAEGRILRLQAAQIEADGGYKFWQISVSDIAGKVIKRWAEIFSEYEKDAKAIRIDYKSNKSGEKLQITDGGITSDGANGGYAAVVTYSGLTVEISKSETVFDG